MQFTSRVCGGIVEGLPYDNRAEPRYPRPGAPIYPEQPRGTKGTTTRLTIAGNRKFESTSLQRRVHCEPDALDQIGYRRADRPPSAPTGNPVSLIGSRALREAGS